MAVYKQRNRGSSNRDDGMYEDEQNSLVPTGRNGSSADASQKASDAINNIDDVLNDTSAASGGFYSGSESAASGSGTSETSTKSLTPGQLESGEADAESSDSGANDGFSFRNESKTKIRGEYWKRRGIIGGIAGVVAGGGIFGAMVLTGPFQIIHYGQMLANISPFHHQESASDARLGRLARWARTKDVGETRIGFFGSQLNKKIVADLKKQGIEIKTDPKTGQLDKLVFDTTKDPRFQGMSPEKKIAAIAADRNINAARITENPSLVKGEPHSGVFTAAMKDIKTNQKRATLKLLVSDENAGRASNWFRFRTMQNRLAVHNVWLHPLREQARKIDQKVADAITAKQDKAKEEERLKSLAEPTEAAKGRLASFRGKLSGPAKVTGTALLGTTLLCTIYEISKDVPTINRLNTVSPAMKSTGDAFGLSGQFMAQQASFSQARSVHQNLADANGKTPFDSPAIKAINGTHQITKGDIDPNIAQAFSPGSSYKNTQKTLDSLHASSICSGIGQAIGIIAGGALVLLSGGVGTVALAGLTAVGSSVALAAIVSGIKSALEKDGPAFIAHQGITGGTIDALGSMELANSSARSSGAVELSPAQTVQLDTQPANQDFASRSIASKLFDVHDYRSLASQLIDKQNPKATQNVANVFSSTLTGFTNLGSSLSSVVSSFTPHAHAAPATPYGLGIPEYGFSEADLNNSLVDNPYDNARYVASNVLDANASDTHGKPYIEKVHDCFGDELSKDGDGNWGINVPVDPEGKGGVDPNSAAYDEAHCSDSSSSDPTWLRVRMFILDTSTVEGYGCYALNNDAACANDGFDTSSANDASLSSTPTASTAGYKNPYRGIKNLIPERVDGGVDYNGNPGPIYAVGPGKVVGIKSGPGSGWPGVPGSYIMYQLTDGPAKDKYIYFAEDCTPTVKVGDILTADSVICNYKYQGTASEIGWSNGSYDYATNDYRTRGGSYASNTGLDFSKFLVSLGAPPGRIEGSRSTVPMPAGWPTW